MMWASNFSDGEGDYESDYPETSSQESDKANTDNESAGSSDDDKNGKSKIDSTCGVVSVPTLVTDECTELVKPVGDQSSSSTIKEDPNKNTVSGIEGANGAKAVGAAGDHKSGEQGVAHRPKQDKMESKKVKTTGHTQKKKKPISWSESRRKEWDELKEFKIQLSTKSLPQKKPKVKEDEKKTEEVGLTEERINELKKHVEYILANMESFKTNADQHLGKQGDINKEYLADNLDVELRRPDAPRRPVDDDQLLGFASDCSESSQGTLISINSQHSPKNLSEEELGSDVTDILTRVRPGTPCEVRLVITLLTSIGYDVKKKDDKPSLPKDEDKVKLKQQKVDRGHCGQSVKANKTMRAEKVQQSKGKQVPPGKRQTRGVKPTLYSDNPFEIEKIPGYMRPLDRLPYAERIKRRDDAIEMLAEAHEEMKMHVLGKVRDKLKVQHAKKQLTTFGGKRYRTKRPLTPHLTNIYGPEVRFGPNNRYEHRQKAKLINIRNKQIIQQLRKSKSTYHPSSFVADYQRHRRFVTCRRPVANPKNIAKILRANGRPKPPAPNPPEGIKEFRDCKFE